MKLNTTAAALLLALPICAVQAQTGCNSDGAVPPQALFERFINADCADCWADPKTPAPGNTAAELDWIVPSAAGDAAALSAAARRDSTERLAELQRPMPMPMPTDVYVSTATNQLPGRFRVALGPAVNDYVGALVSYAGGTPANMASEGFGVWLALVEQIPAGADGTAVPRNLVRGMFHTQWQPSTQLRKNERINLPANTRWINRVSMQLPAGTHPERLALLGWVKGADAQIVGIAQAVCPPP